MVICETVSQVSYRVTPQFCDYFSFTFTREFNLVAPANSAIFASASEQSNIVAYLQGHAVGSNQFVVQTVLNIALAEL